MTARAAPRRLRDRGFTLIEVLVALVITLIALEALTGGIISSLRIAQDTETWDRAVSRAESHLAAITDPGQLLGERAGQEADGFRWRTRVAFMAAASVPDSERRGPWARGTGLYSVSVTVFWRRGRADHSFKLDSARIGPLPGAGP